MGRKAHVARDIGISRDYSAICRSSIGRIYDKAKPIIELQFIKRDPQHLNARSPAS